MVACYTPSMESLACQHLSSVDPQMLHLIESIGALDFAPRSRRSLFESLVSAVAHQQLHATAAQSILRRFCALFPGKRFPIAAEVLRKRHATLRKVGFSEAKALAIRDIAQKTVDGVVPSARLIVTLSDDEIIERLTQIRGVGRWTGEMLLIFQLGRPDVFPADDFGVRLGYKVVFGAHRELKPKQFREYAERWAPYRTYAALYFWRAADRAKGE